MRSGQHRMQHEFDRLEEGRLRLSEAVVDQVLAPLMAKEAVRDALVCHAKGDCVQPLKPYVRPRGRSGEYAGGRFIAMPAYVGPPVDAAGIKWIAGFARNVEMGRPRASAMLMLNSVVTGSIIAEMDCGVLSARRTGAVAAICVELLAVSGSKRVALLGAGPINHAVVEALAHLSGSVERFRVYDPRRDRVKQMRDGFGRTAMPPITASRSPQECVRDAQVVVAATTGGKSYLEREWIGPGTLLVMLSLDDPTPELFLGADKVIVDDFDHCNREQKLIHRLVEDGRFNRRRVHAELGEIVAGMIPGREGDEEIILVNPMGMAIEDITVGKAVYMAAKQQGLGDYLPPSLRNDLPEGFMFQPQFIGAPE